MYPHQLQLPHQPHLLCEQSAPDFWGEPIYTYTRAQAIADGVLVDADAGELAPVSRQHFGAASVAMTAGLHALIERAVNNPKYWNDWRGVWHDVCWMSKLAPGRRILTRDLEQTVWFKVIIVGAGRTRYHTLKRVTTPTGEVGLDITFMLADED